MWLICRVLSNVPVNAAATTIANLHVDNCNCNSPHSRCNCNCNCNCKQSIAIGGACNEIEEMFEKQLIPRGRGKINF